MANGDITKKLNKIGIDAICDMIELEDMSYRAIAKRIGVSLRGLSDWINGDMERSARARESREIYAHEAVAKARQVLLDISADATPAQITQARELASQYRWEAKSRNPQTYGDKQSVNHGGNVSLVVTSWIEDD